MKERLVDRIRRTWRLGLDHKYSMNSEKVKVRLANQAADEIERLEREVKRLESHVASLQNENARLRYLLMTGEIPRQTPQELRNWWADLPA